MKRNHPKTDSIVIMFASGETETIRNLSTFTADAIFEKASKRPVIVTQTSKRENGEIWQRDDRTEWMQVK